MARTAATGALLECPTCGLQFDGERDLEAHVNEQHAGMGM
jgi:uncharacterized C2H2 Zn-finger protein